MGKRFSDPVSSMNATFTGDEKLVVLHGKENFLQIEHMRRLRAAVEEKTGGEAESIHYDGERAQLADVLDEARSFGLMQQHKIVVVTDAEEFVKKHRAALERYAAAPVETATLVLRSEAWNKGNLDKAIEKVGRIIKCEAPGRAEAEAWLVQRAGDVYGVKVDRAAVSALFDHLGVEMGRLDTELGKLAVGVPAGGTVTAGQVEALVGHASDEMAWEIQDALLSGNAGRAVSKLHELVDLAGHDPVPITWSVSDLMRKLHHAAAMADEGANPFTICSALKIWPKERQQPFLSAARKLGKSRAAQLMDTIIEMDRRSKSGFAEGVTNLERFCVQFAAAMKN